MATPVVYQSPQSPLAVWPWPKAQKESLHPGVTHWYLDASATDATQLDLLEFDFAANPHLRLELFDQDQDDAHPFDNQANFWARGVWQVTRQLNAARQGKVVAAWNGLFFGFDHQGVDGIAEHVAPVVLQGQVHYAGGNHRWTFGVQYHDGKPEFKTIHLPDTATLAREYDYAAGAAQSLIREGAPLRLQPVPRPGEAPLKSPVLSTPEEAGHIPVVDHFQTSRVSLGWSRDSTKLMLLFVKDFGTETENALAFRHGRPGKGGWTLADLQRFWQAKQVWGAINSDGGGPAQLTFLLRNGHYLFIPAQWAAGNQRLEMSPAASTNAPQGGTLMYFYVRDTASQ